MNKAINSVAIALAVLAVLSFGTHAYAQNATNFRDHGHFPFLGIRGHIGLGLPQLPLVPHIAVAPPAVRPDFNRFHDFALAHHDHFIFLNGQYVVLPETVGCPLGSSLDAITGECVIVSQAIITQAAPTILSESIQSPSIVQQQSTMTTTQTVAPNISCPAGSTLQPDNTCQVTTTSTQNVPAIITCPVGTSLQNNVCVEVQQQIVVAPLPCPSCPAGSDLVNGQCVVNALPSQVTVGTTPGEIIVLGHHFEHNGDLPFLRR